MDQAASSVGGFVQIDFKDKDHPEAQKVDFDFTKCGYALCIIDTKGSHSDLTPDYAAVPAEMKEVAAFFGKEVLREVDEEGVFMPILQRFARRWATVACCVRCTSLRTTPVCSTKPRL